MRRPLIAIGAIVMGAVVVAAQRDVRRGDALVPGALNARTYSDGGVEYRYQLFVPRHYDPSRRWPLVVALHGSREKGTDGVLQSRVGLAPIVLEQAASFPAVAVFPQVHPRESVSHVVTVMQRIADAAAREVNADPRRVYLTGLSFGGIIAYDMALRAPGHYAAVVPVAAQPIVLASDGTTRLTEVEVDAALARALHDTPMWIFHGAHDSAVPADRVRRLVPALRAAGITVTYTEYAEGGHEIWDRAYRSPALWSWVFSQHR
jgi:predicted peptidase